MEGKLIAEIQDVFFKALEYKTGWGKEELKRLYLQCQNQVLRDHIDKTSNNGPNIKHIEMVTDNHDALKGYTDKLPDTIKKDMPYNPDDLP